MDVNINEYLTFYYPPVQRHLNNPNELGFCQFINIRNFHQFNRLDGSAGSELIAVQFPFDPDFCQAVFAYY